MFKKKCNERVSSKTVSARLVRKDLYDYLALKEYSDIKPLDVFRVGLRTLIENKKYPDEVKLISKRLELENRMYERALNDVCDGLMLDSILHKQNEQIISHKLNQKKRLVKLIEKEHLIFMENTDFDSDIRDDLTQFYNIRRDAISIYAMKCGYLYDDAVEFYDEYLEKNYNDVSHDCDDVGLIH